MPGLSDSIRLLTNPSCFGTYLSNSHDTYGIWISAQDGILRRGVLPRIYISNTQSSVVSCDHTLFQSSSLYINAVNAMNMDNPRPQATIRRCLYRDLDSVLNIYNFYVSRTLVSLDQDIQSMSDLRDLYNSVLDQDLPFLVVTLGYDDRSTKNEEQILGYGYAHNFRPLPTFRSTVEILMYLDQDATGRGIGKNLLAVLMGVLKSVHPRTDLEYGIREVLAIVPVEEGRDASKYPTA